MFHCPLITKDVASENEKIIEANPENKVLSEIMDPVYFNSIMQGNPTITRFYFQDYKVSCLKEDNPDNNIEPFELFKTVYTYKKEELDDEINQHISSWSCLLRRRIV